MDVNLNRRELERLAANHPDVTRERLAMARRISTRAAARTRVGRTGNQRDSHRVEYDQSQTPPRVAAVAGERKAWPYVFQEFGGSGFRPPPAPLRTAARAEGLTVDPRATGNRRRR